MIEYEKPLVEILDDEAEGIFAASGEKTKCRFNRPNFNPNADACQACFQSGGTDSKIKGVYKSDNITCIDNFPLNSGKNEND